MLSGVDHMGKSKQTDRFIEQCISLVQLSSEEIATNLYKSLLINNEACKVFQLHCLWKV